MEPPSQWNALTAALAVCDLTQPHRTWAFLVVQGLVADGGRERDVFFGIVDAELRQGEITGPSIPFRVASGLFNAQIALPAGRELDADAVRATERLVTIAAFGPGALGHERLDQLRRMQGDQRHGPRPAARRRWWRFW